LNFAIFDSGSSDYLKPGKTTLLNRIANWEDLEGFPRHLRVLIVRQELTSENEETSVIQAVLEADIERQTLLQEEKELVARLENQDEPDSTVVTIKEKQKILEAKASDDKFAEDLKKLKDVYERLQLLSSDTAEVRAATILSGLQFSPEMQDAPIKSLSGGWRMRVALAAALQIEPDILMLDEPTNHLDLEAIVWLERYLMDYPHTVIVVSHDRGFLNAICTDIIEFKKKKLKCKSDYRLILILYRLRGSDADTHCPFDSQIIVATLIPTSGCGMSSLRTQCVSSKPMNQKGPTLWSSLKSSVPTPSEPPWCRAE
jgi:ATP-binding cassette subfamily F protein 3